MQEALVCIRCPHASFLDPKKEVCYKTGGLRQDVEKVHPWLFQPRSGRSEFGRTSRIARLFKARNSAIHPWIAVARCFSTPCYRKKLREIVGKYETCRLKAAGAKRKKGGR